MPGFWNCITSALAALYDFIAPDACHLCGQASHGESSGYAAPRSPASLLAAPLDHHIAGLTVRSHPVCMRCARHFPRAHGVVDLGGGLPSLAPFLTGDALLRIIHTIKFQRYRGLSVGAAAAMAAVLAEQSDFVGPHPVLVAVPMDSRALRKRGFNQSADLAAGIARVLGLDVSQDGLMKCRRTRPQSLTPRRDRTGNVENAFAVRRNTVRDRNVLIVDDVVTTGATVRACSEVLRRAGAASTAVISLGRSPLAGTTQNRRKTPFLLS